MERRLHVSRASWPLVVGVAAVLAAVGGLVVLGAASLAGVEVVVPGPDGAMAPLAPVIIVLACVIAASAAGGLALALTRWSGAPRRWFLILTVCGLVLSFGAVATAGVPGPVAVVLAAMHLLAAAAIIPVLAARTPVSARRAAAGGDIR